MAYRSITSVRRADRILKSGLFTGNFNILAQPKQLELRQFLSKLAHPLKGSGKPLGPKEGNKSATLTADGIGADRKSSLFTGGTHGPEDDEEKSSGRPTPDADSAKQSVPADLAELVNAANSKNLKIQYDAVSAICKLLYTDPKSTVDTLISSNVLPTLVSCLSFPNSSPALQIGAAGALEMIAAGTSEHTQAVVEAGAAPHFLKLLTSPHPMTREVALAALGTIIGKGPQLRDYVINLGVVAPLLNLIQPDVPITMLRHVARVILNVCLYRDPLPLQTLQDILRALNVLVDHKDTGVLIHTVWAISKLAESGKKQIQMLIDNGIVPKLVQLLKHPDLNVQMVSVRAIFYIIAGTREQAHAVLNCGALSYFPSLINHPNENICKGAMMILKMVTTGKYEQEQAVIDAGLIPLIIQHLEKRDFETQKEAAWIITNMIIERNKEQVAYLVNCGVIAPLCNLLDCEDSEITLSVLCGIQIILSESVNQDGGDKVRTSIEECGGLDVIKSLRNHENKFICKISYNIIRYYFSEDVGEDANHAPLKTTDSGRNQFNWLDFFFRK